MNHFLAVFKARNTEFFRDRASMAWNFIFPILLIVGFAIMFGGGGKALYKIGNLSSAGVDQVFQELKEVRHLEVVDYQDKERALEKLRQHSLDLVVEPATGNYWVNEDAPKGYFLEKVMLGVSDKEKLNKQVVTGEPIRYVDWVLPGILGMNMMFSCLFGVGYVIVRYRKNGVLKRLKATPLSAFSFLTAQVASRLFVVLTTTALLFASTNIMFDFKMSGSWLALILVTVLGAMSMISLGLMMASQTKSEELAGGLLNLVTWPMMIMSGVWFSLEGSPQSVQMAAQILPLTHLLEGARAVMIDGAGLIEISKTLFVLSAMTLSFLLLGAWRFQWGE